MGDQALQLTDAQQTAIERTDLSMAVTSGAGCGKTFVLVRRYLQALTDDGRADAPSRVVAVTFTDKAAIEMRQRVADLLVKRIADTDNPVTKALLGEWLNRLPDGRISTIHGFCAALLRGHAIEAGIDPSFTVLADDFLARRLLNDAVAQAAKAAFDTPDERRLQLLDDLRHQQILDMLVAAVSERWRWSPADYADPAVTLDRWVALRDRAADGAWAALDDAALRAELTDLAGMPCADPADKLAAHLAEQLAVMTRLLNDPQSRTADTIGQLKSAGTKGAAANWGSVEAAKVVRDRFRDLLERFGVMAVYCEPMGECDQRAARHVAVLTELAANAAARHVAAKRRAGLLDYTDLLIKTRDLLATDPAVRRRVADGIEHLLIDEFQDTDSLQHELLQLAVDCVEGGPSSGRVFFVGDAKQSIYRFRGAEVEVFNDARDSVAPEGRCSLDLNFRTHAPGLALVNRIFAPLMDEAYESLSAYRKECPEGPAAEFLLVECEDRADVQQRGTARAMATRIAEMVGSGEKRVWDAAAGAWRPVRFGDVAILLPRFQNTGPYEDALSDAGVDHYVVGGTGLFRQQEVYDLCNALRAINNPLDDIALMGFLRGGMVGLADNVLTHIATELSPPYRRRLDGSALTARLPAGDHAALTAAVALVDRLGRIKDACGIDELLERLLAATGFEATLLGQFHGRRRCGNVRRVLAHARQAQQSGATLSEFVDFLSELTIEEIRAEQAATDAEGGDVVRLMTIHKAKGLEFPVVFLADLNYRPADIAPPFGLRGPWGLTLRTQDDNGDGESVSWRLARDAERAESLREDCRKLYVATTRHQDHIVFVPALQWSADRLGRPTSALRQLDDALDLAGALATGRVTLGDGAEVPVRTVKPEVTRAEVGVSILDGLYARCTGPDELAAALAAGEEGPSQTDALPHLAPAGPPAVERIGVTALAALGWCPACFRWQHELRVPAEAIAAIAPEPSAAAETDPSSRRPGGLDGAAAGTVFHRCMELLDFLRPQSAPALVRQALADLAIATDPAPLAEDLAAMLAGFAAHPLGAMLANSSRRLTELAFTTRIDRLQIDGVIDLLTRDAEGRWHIIDYKSDRVSAADIAAHADRYALQMQIYAAAAARYLGVEQAGDGIGATLHFLRPAVAHVFAAEELVVADTEQRVGELAQTLAECRRNGRWPRRDDGSCRHCRYALLCRRESNGTARAGAV